MAVQDQKHGGRGAAAGSGFLHQCVVGSQLESALHPGVELDADAQESDGAELMYMKLMK